MCAFKKENPAKFNFEWITYLWTIIEFQKGLVNIVMI